MAVGIELGIRPILSPVYGKDRPGYSLVNYDLGVNTESRVLRISRMGFLQPVPAGFNLQCLGMICRKEWQLDKLSPVPVRFRLGSLEQVNYLEQKPNAIKSY